MVGGRKRGWGWSLVVPFVCAALVLGGTGVAGARGAAKKSAGSGELVVGFDLSASITPIAFDPVDFTGPSGFFTYNWPVYAGLLRLTPSGAYVPDLAAKVTVTDPSTIEIEVRPGLVYSDGTPLDAAAVKAGLERNQTNANAGAWSAAMYALSSIDVTGKNALVLHFSEPKASSFYPLLASEEGFMAIPSGPTSGSPNTNVLGAGPFVLKSYAANSEIELVKNPKYWNAKAIKLDAITFTNVPSGPQSLNALTSGLVDVIVGLEPSDVSSIEGRSGFQTNSTFPDASFNWVSICKASGPLADVKVRQALNYATNRTAINDALLLGQGEPAWSIFPTSSVFFNRALDEHYAYNPKKAKKLLAAAGYADGFSTSLMALPQPGMDQLAEVLQSDWKKIGVSMEIIPTTNYVTDLYRQNKAEMGLQPSGLPGIQKITSSYIPGTVGDLCQYDDPELHAISDQIQAAPPNSPELKELWNQAQDIIIGDALGVYIAYAPIVTGASKAVRNLEVIPYVGGVANYWALSVSK